MSGSTFILELACNLRWLLWHLTHRLDPVAEERYAHTVNCARRVESALARSFATVNTLKELPAEALMLAQEGVVYLLVAECVLGHCPPTMHPFLLRAKMSNSSLLSDCMSGTSSNCSASSLQNAAHMYQCQFLCVRWLTAEGLLTDEELLDALCEEDETLRGRQESRFDLHVAMAKRLSIACSFSPRAHVVLTRALLLHHCSTLVSVEDLSLHLRFLNPQNSVELCELESGLLFWMRYVLKAMWRSGQITEELYTTATQELDGSLYQSLKSGLILALVVHFYKPCVLSLARIIDDSETATACGTPQRCHLKRWAVLLRVSEEMSISPNLYADEVTQFGTVVLHLHVLRFVEELFAVLATLAEVTGDFHGCCDEDYEIQTAPGLQRENFSTESVDKLALSSKMECESAHETGSTHHGELNTTSSGGSCGVPVTRSDAQTNTNSTLSIYQSFPSQHSRRQYEVMKTSLRQLSVEVENEPQVSEHSPHQVRSPSRFGKSFEWRHSSTDESFPQGIFVQQDVAKHNARRPGSSWSELRRSHDTFQAPISSWENRRDDVDLVSSSPLVPSLVDSSAYFHASLGDSHHGFHPCYVHRAQTSGSAGVSVVRIAEPSVESTDVLSLERHTAALPARAIASTLSWPTSESSFPMNMVGTPRASLNKDCSTVTTPQEGGRIPEACIPATVSSSSVVKPVVYGSCSHLSSLTHEFTTSSEVTPLDTCSSSSGRDAQPRSIKSMKKSSQAPSSQVDERGFDVQSVLREVASLNPAFLVATGSRRTLLRTLEHQKELLQRLANKFLEAK
uniref:Uncharacterized protein n=1 Tax=Trypanosoma vivax (strain Y486) TaxID=1055687 RepID=G0U7U7_TRYVY|nr:conserved hypothetical protein, fragment [Trypanosoma vivax Y486]